jgi:elongation factor G
VRQADGRGHYAHVKLRVSPGERGSGYVFENATIGLPIRGEFISAIEEGTRAGAEGGALAGYPIDDVRVIVCDGSYHDVDSSAQAFRHAARLAFDEAARKAQPVLLEPIMSVDVDVPAECEPVVSDGLLARRANMFGLFEDYPDAGTVRIAVTVPLAEMFGYRVELRERTRGRGTFAMSLSQYAPVTLAGEDGDPEAEVREPRKPRSPLKGLRASAPEPPDDSA